MEFDTIIKGGDVVIPKRGTMQTVWTQTDGQVHGARTQRASVLLHPWEHGCGGNALYLIRR